MGGGAFLPLLLLEQERAEVLEQLIGDGLVVGCVERGGETACFKEAGWCQLL
jgi:hypothetical protein